MLVLKVTDDVKVRPHRPSAPCLARPISLSLPLSSVPEVQDGPKSRRAPHGSFHDAAHGPHDRQEVRQGVNRGC